MANVRIIEVHQGVFEANDLVAAEVRAINNNNGTFMLNVMASPGSGKTTLLMATLKELIKTNPEIKIGVMEADIDASVDAEKIATLGGNVRSIQVHTGGECAMDAQMALEAITEFDTRDLDLLILENVGNLVCPAETDTGADCKVVLLSVPEGDDKPLKYPLMFEVADIVLITKIDTMSFFNFDREAVVKNIRMRNPNASIIFLSAKTGEGMTEWMDYLQGKLITA